MKIGLKSGYEFFCDDGYYPDTNKLDGEVTYTFISLGHWLSRKSYHHA